VGGGVEFAASAFFAEFDDPADASLANGSTGRLDFEAKGGRAEAAFKLKISEAILSENPSKLIDEAYVRLFIGPAAVEGGLLKVVWGKADSQSVLDVLNPLDLTDLSITDNLERKIGQPMLRASASIGLSSKIDAAFIPYFTPNSVAWEGRWMPAQIGSYKKLLGIAALEDAEGKIDFPDTETLEYAQGGFRFTTTVGSVDLGAQYFCGLLPTMAVSPKDVKAYLTAAAYHAQNPAYPEPSPIPVSYDRYHQAGADAAAELFGLNWRAETGLNLTGDLGGDDPDVYNPSWSGTSASTGISSPASASTSRAPAAFVFSTAEWRTMGPWTLRTERRRPRPRSPPTSPRSSSRIRWSGRSRGSGAWRTETFLSSRTSATSWTTPGSTWPWASSEETTRASSASSPTRATSSSP
jgi:hypothetical protein